MRLVVLTVGVLFALLLGYSAIKMLSESQVYTPFKTNYYKADEKLFIVPWEQSYLLEKKADLVLWVDVYRNKQGELLAKPWKDIKLAKKDLTQEASPTRPLLSDLLKKYPQTRWVINCDDNTQDIQVTLNAVIGEAKMTDFIMIQSNYNTILESLKESQPMLLYGSSIADITRLKTFQSMGLVAASPFKGDVFFAPLSYLDRKTINEGLVSELRRRFKKVFLGPLMNSTEMAEAQKFNPDGLFVADPFLVPL